MNTRQKVRTQDAVLPAIRMYSEEVKKIRADAAKAGLKLSEYVRQSLLKEEKETPAPEPKEKRVKPRTERKMHNTDAQARKVKRDQKKDGKCPHGFLLIDGATACPVCP